MTADASTEPAPAPAGAPTDNSGNLIRGTAESLLSRLEDNVNGDEQQQQLEESELLQVRH